METSLSATKKRQGTPFPQMAKGILINVFEGLQKDFPELTKTGVMEKLHSYTGVSIRTIQRFEAEKKRNSKLGPPKSRASFATLIHIDERDKYLIKQIVQDLLLGGRNPTLTDILAEVRKNHEIPPMSRSKLHEILRKDLNFKHDRRQQRSRLEEPPESLK